MRHKIVAPRGKGPVPALIAVAALAIVALLVVVVRSGSGSSAGSGSGDSSPDPGSSDATSEIQLAHQASRAQVKADIDRFGISYLHPTLPDGNYWLSDWEAKRSFRGIDPEDDWFDADHGQGRYVAGNGRLAVSGQTPRMYIHDPQLERQWKDVEITLYARRVRDEDIPFAGLTVVARANHLSTEDVTPSGETSTTRTPGRCDTRGYGARLRFDGTTDFEKETAHPRNQAIANTEVFPGGMPRDVWIGIKFLVFDRDDGVHLQMWLDQTDGEDGGEWHLINEIVDNGRLFGNVSCAPGIDPMLPLTNSPDRQGSESGKPNVSVYFRSDGIGTDGLVYKWASVREITE